MIPEPIVAGDLRLRAWEPGEVESYLSGRDATVFELTTEQASLGAEECRANIEAARLDPNLAPFAICDRDDRPVGNMAVSRQGSDAVLSYWLSPEARGRGWAAVALEAASDWAVRTWEVDRLILEILPVNRTSIRTAEAAGYRRAGLRLDSACGGPAILYQR